MANATNTEVGRSVGHEWAVSVATSGQFCWPPTGSSYWPLTHVGERGELWIYDGRLNTFKLQAEYLRVGGQ
jgi:hypothetical protein